MTNRFPILWLLTGILLFNTALIFAQTNCWTNSTGGNWEDPYWSLGILPGANQAIFLTNSGVKTLAIGTNTTQKFPETLNVDSLTISAPMNSSNTLVLNDAGVAFPLTVEKYFTVNDNSTVEVHSSAIRAASGIEIGGGHIILDGGVVVANGLNASSFYGAYATSPSIGTFSQSGGYHTNSGIAMRGTYDFDGNPVSCRYELTGGILSTPSVVLSVGQVIQSGGTSQVESVTVGSASHYDLSDGWLLAQNVYDIGPPESSLGSEGAWFLQSGGTNQINGEFLIDNSSFYRITAGRLIANSVAINNGSQFYDYGGDVEIKRLSLGGGRSGGTWNEQSNGRELGQLVLASYDSASFFMLPDHPCVLKFADSSNLAWSTNSALIIQEWSGSLYGGGSQQVVFGSNSVALAPQQLGAIQFQNPGGLSPGKYPARILGTGEIVPDTGAPLPATLKIKCDPTHRAMQLTLGGEIGQSYDIEVSTDLVDWILWTNRVNSNGTILINDCGATNCFQRFFRAQQSSR